MTAFDTAIAALAAKQLGVFSRRQALDAGGTPGMIRHRLKKGAWQEVLPNVYRVGGAPETFEQSVMAACLAAGAGAAASHLTAACLWGLEGVKRGEIEVTIPASRDVAIEGVTVHRSRRWAPSDTTLIGPVPVTAVDRTSIDLLGVLDEDAFERMADSAIRRELVTLARLGWILGRIGRGVKGVGTLRRFLGARKGKARTGSNLERKLQRILRAAGLPRPVSQLEVRERGKLLGRVDWGYPDLKVFLETDGYGSHLGAAALDAHDRRQNRLTTRGWLPVRFTPRDLDERPGEVAADVARARALRGLGLM